MHCVHASTSACLSNVPCLPCMTVAQAPIMPQRQALVHQQPCKLARCVAPCLSACMTSISQCGVHCALGDDSGCEAAMLGHMAASLLHACNEGIERLQAAILQCRCGPMIAGRSSSGCPAARESVFLNQHMEQGPHHHLYAHKCPSLMSGSLHAGVFHACAPPCLGRQVHCWEGELLWCKYCVDACSACAHNWAAFSA
jgi:hypothetical protein